MDLATARTGIAKNRFVIVGRVGMDVIADPPGPIKNDDSATGTSA